MSTLPSLSFPANRPAQTPATTTAQLTPAAEIRERLSSLYRLTQQSSYVFGSPLGPFFHHAQTFHLPRFVYFGPGVSDASIRLAFLSGHDRQAYPAALALLAFIRRLAQNPDIGHRLNLSFFPLLDVLGVFNGKTGRTLTNENWGASNEPEVTLLERDTRLHGYQGFVHIATAAVDQITVRLRAGRSAHTTTDIEFISSDIFDPWPVRFESSDISEVGAGPLSISDDLPVAPFELSLTFPENWPAPALEEAVASVLTRFVIRHRGDQAYGQNL